MGEYVIGKVGLFQDQLNVLIQEHTSIRSFERAFNVVS